MADDQTLPAELTIFTVGESLSQYRTWLETPSDAALNGQPLALHADDVVDIDAAGVQLLISLSHSLSRRGRPLQLVNPSVVLSDACHALGASSLLCTMGSGEPE